MNENFDEYYSSFNAEPSNSVPAIIQNDKDCSEYSCTFATEKRALSCPNQPSESNSLLIISDQSKKISKKQKRIINWTDKEDQILFAKTMELGFDWQKIITFLPQKSRIDVKNHFHSVLKTVLKEIKCPSTQLSSNPKKPIQKESNLKRLLFKAVISEENYFKIQQAQKEQEKAKNIQIQKPSCLQKLKLKHQTIYLCSQISLTEEIFGFESSTLENQLREIIFLIQSQADCLRTLLLQTIFDVESYAENNFLSENKEIRDICSKIQDIIQNIDTNSQNVTQQLNFAIERYQGNDINLNLTEIQAILSGSIFTFMQTMQDLSKIRIEIESACQFTNQQQQHFLEEN